MNNVEVEMERGFENYRLPDPGSEEELIEAIRLSWGLLDVAPARITAPLLGMVYAAPLSEIVVPEFTLWLWGGTGSYKSTLAALMLSHFGDFTEVNLPLSFESTSNALERSLFLAKDVLVIVDDWRPGVTRADSDDMDRKAQRLLRAVGNRQGRNRMTADTSLRPSYPPRGAVVATAEALPEGPAFQSANSRALCVNVTREEVDLEKLSEVQGRKDMLSSAMAGYIRFVAARYDTLADKLPELRVSLREERLRPLLGSSHPRTPGNAAVLVIGLRTLRDFAVEIGALEKEEAEDLYRRGREGIVEAARAHVQATGGADPTSRFIEILRALFDAGRVYAADRRTGEKPPRCKQLGWEKTDREEAICSPVGFDEDQPVATEDRPPHAPRRGADQIGWADRDHLYLNKDLAFGAVSGYAQRNGLPFGIKPRMLWDALARSSKSLTDSGRTDTSAKVQGMTKRVVQIPRSAVFQSEVEDEG